MFVRLRAVHRQLGAYFTDLRKARENALPYVTRFTATNALSANLLPPNDFPGLLFIQCVENHQGTTEVIAYWRSQEAALSNEPVFGSMLNAGPPAFAGYLRGFKGQEKSWWQRIPVGRWILYAASIFGALAVLQTHFARLLESPDITLEVPGPQPLNVLAGDEISFDLAITNRSREAYSLVTLLRPMLYSRNVQMVHGFSGSLKPAPIAPASIDTVPMKGGPLSAGQYKLMITAHAKTGHFRKSDPFRVEKQFRVWSREPVANFIPPPVHQDKRRASLKGQVLIGAAAPKGLSCQATMAGPTTTEFGFVDFPGVVDWRKENTTDTRSIVFATARPFDGLRRISFEISVDSSLDVVNWRTLLANSQIECQRVEE